MLNCSQLMYQTVKNKNKMKKCDELSFKSLYEVQQHHIDLMDMLEQILHQSFTV